MSDVSDFEAEREANIARNRALIAQLDISLDLPQKKPPKTKAKPVQPSKRVKREAAAPAVATRQSTRLRRTMADPNESPSKKRKREQEEELLRQKLEQERLEEEERLREAKKPRHQDLDMKTLVEDLEPAEITELTTVLQTTSAPQTRRVGSQDAFVYNDKQEKVAVSDLKERLKDLKVVARAKVTQDRVYCAAYHPEPSKDLIFFGDKHGQLGIWDARAAADDVDDEDIGSAPDTKAQGKYWRLQMHWPATSKSSISTIKFDPTNSHNLYTSAYDCTVRSLDFTSGVSREVYSMDDTLISSIDLTPTGNEMWISDALGGVTHLDLREQSKARRYELSPLKIGSVSINPVDTHLLLTATNNRTLNVWDARMLEKIAVPDDKPAPIEIGAEDVDAFRATKEGKATMRGEWTHDKSVSSAYWDPHGRRIVSTSYDDTIRLWDIKPEALKKNAPFPSFRPLKQISHNCQTGKWLTILKAQWSSNPDVYPHFTIGNMNHSLDVFSCKGDLIASLSDKKLISAVQAVTCSHPNVLERFASGNASGRCVLWAPPDV